MSKWLLTAFEISGGGNSIKYQASKRPPTSQTSNPYTLSGCSLAVGKPTNPPTFASQPENFPLPSFYKQLGCN